MNVSNESSARAPLAGTATTAVTVGQPFRRVSWGAVIAGMVIAVVVQLALGLLGTGIGMSTVDPLHYSSPSAAALGTGAGIWWVVSSIVALFAGGWVAGHLAGSAVRTDVVLHGLLTWGVATLVTVYLLASAISAVVSGGASVVGKAATVTAAGAAAVAGPATDMAKQQLDANGITLDSLKSKAQDLLAQTGKPGLQPGAIAGQASAAAGQMTSAAASAGSTGAPATADLQSTLQKIITAGKSTVDQADRTAIVNVVMAQTGVAQPEAEQRVDAWIKNYQDARAKFQQQKAEAEVKARQAADAAASASSKAAFGAFVALLLGALAAALGGMAARRQTAVVLAGRHAAA